jgi:hypothetical protein
MNDQNKKLMDAPPELMLWPSRRAEISRFLTLKPNEASYISSIERGEVRPEMLFMDDLEAAQRLAEHPAILWKVANVRAHLKGRRPENSGS